VPRNGPLASVAELALVRGFDARALARLAPHVTVAGEHAVDPNTASPEVLLAVVGNAAAVDRLLAARARAPIGDDDVDALLGDAAARPLLVTRAQYYAVRVVSGVGEIRRGVEATVWAPAGVAPTVVAWRPFTPDAGASPGTWR
jgi:type II secretory pathway component PulK